MPQAVQIAPYRPQVSVEGGQRVTPQMSGMSLGPALEDVGAGLEHVVRSEAASYTLKTAADAEQAWHEEILKRQQSAEPGAPNFTPTLLKDYDAYAKQASKAAPNGLAAQMVNKQLLQLRSTLASRAMSFESSEAIRHNTEVAAQSIDNAGNEVMNDPTVYGQRLADRQALISHMNLDPGTREKLQQHAKDELSKFATMGAIERDPYATMVELASGKSPLPYVSSLSPELRTQLMTHADQVLRSRVADATRLDSMAEKQQEQARQEVLKQGVLLGKQGGLTPDWITKNAPLLKAEDVDHLYRELSGGENVKSDIHTYSNLLTRASGGEDVTTESTNAYTRGLLSHDDFTRLVTTSAKEIPTPYKRGASYIKQALDTQMNPDPDRNKSLADALTEYQDWFEKNPAATADDAQKKAESLSTRYRLFGAQDALFNLKPPLYLVGSRAQPDIDATEQKTAEAVKSGELSRDEFNKQAALLAQWRKAVDVSQAKKAAAAKAREEQQ